MGHLTGAKTKRQVTSIEVVADDNLHVLRFSASESGSFDISQREATESEWSYKPFATLTPEDAKLIATVLTGGDTRYDTATQKRAESLTTPHSLPKPEEQKGPMDGDCTPLDVERAKGENLREERENIQLLMERDHALDKHVGFTIPGCPACDRAIRPGYGDGSLRPSDSMRDVQGSAEAEANGDLDDLPI